MGSSKESLFTDDFITTKQQQWERMSWEIHSLTDLLFFVIASIISRLWASFTNLRFVADWIKSAQILYIHVQYFHRISTPTPTLPYHMNKSKYNFFDEKLVYTKFHIFLSDSIRIERYFHVCIVSISQWRSEYRF